MSLSARIVKILMNYPASSIEASKPYQDGLRPKGQGMDPLKKFRRSAAGAALFVLCLLAAAGCSGPLKVGYTPAAKQGAISPVPVSVLVTDFKDARDIKPGADPRTIGRIGTTVFDINWYELTLAKDPAALVTEAFAKELTASGYEVKGEGTADFVLTGELREFRLDIVSRDRIAVAFQAEIRERETGRVVWSGVVAEKEDRYAGVTGNSRASIARYINATLSKVVGGVVAGAAPKIADTRTAYRPPAPAPEQAPAIERLKKAPEGTGRLVLSTSPGRAKVYIGGVYYGLTPLSLDLDPGIYEVTVKSKGYKDSGERVSVRRGEFTELEMELEGE